jgi:hypothetical protein
MRERAGDAETCHDRRELEDRDRGSGSTIGPEQGVRRHTLVEPRYNNIAPSIRSSCILVSVPPRAEKPPVRPPAASTR